MTIKERLTKIKQRLALYYTAEEAVLAGQSYSIGSRSVTRANLAWIRSQIKDLEKQEIELEGMLQGKRRRTAFRITPRDI